MNEELRENNSEILRDIISEAQMAIEAIEDEIDSIQQCFIQIESKVQDLEL